MESASTGKPHPLRAVRREPARQRLGGVSSAAGRHVQACALGAGTNGDSRERADLSAGPRNRPRPCRNARRQSRALGDGGGRKMLRPVSRYWRIVRRPRRARFYRDPAAGGRIGAQRRSLLAGSARRQREPQRSTDALAGRECAIASQCAGRAGTGATRLGGRAVPRAWGSARTMGGGA